MTTSNDPKMDERVVDPAVGPHPAYLQGRREAERFLERHQLGSLTEFPAPATTASASDGTTVRPGVLRGQAEAEAFFARRRRRSPLPRTAEPDSSSSEVEQAGSPLSALGWSTRKHKLKSSNSTNVIPIASAPVQSSVPFIEDSESEVEVQGDGPARDLGKGKQRTASEVASPSVHDEFTDWLQDESDALAVGQQLEFEQMSASERAGLRLHQHDDDSSNDGRITLSSKKPTGGESKSEGKRSAGDPSQDIGYLPKTRKPFLGGNTKAEKPAGRSAFSHNEAKLSKKNAPAAVRVTDLPDVANPTPPVWYSALSAPNTRVRGSSSSSSVDELFRKIRNAITVCEKVPRGQPLPEGELAKINTGIHQAFFVRFNDNRLAKTVIRGSRMLHNDSGLPRLFHLAGDGTQLPPYPFYIVADSKELYTKWWMEDLSPNLYRGIVEGRPENVKLGRSKETDKLDLMYPNRVTGDFHGNGPLLNGQWWPSQLCAVRDGAHNSSIAGISGNEGDGAWSVIVAVAPNIDKGDEIWYCGTEGRNGEKTAATAATALMFENISNKQPVRVIRSSKEKGSEYRPAQGYRYDGLYDVLGSTLLNVDKAHYRFHLKRQSGQGPIRWTGPGARPTPEEIIAFQTHKVEIKYTV